MSKSGSVKIGNTDMNYVAFGNSKKALVVMPGLSDGLATVKGKGWILATPYKPYFKDYSVYMFSRKNDMPEGYSIKDMADDQVEAMRSLGIEKACILGVSQGGMIAQYIAINHPEVVEKLILAVTAPYANEVVTDAVKGWIEMAERKDHLELMDDTARKMYTDRFYKQYQKYFPVVARLTRQASYERFFRNAYAILDFDARDELAKITSPTLIIAGSDDKTVGNKAKDELHDGIIGSELYVYEGLGHGAFEEAKDFYKRVAEFCG